MADVNRVLAFWWGGGLPGSDLVDEGDAGVAPLSATRAQGTTKAPAGSSWVFTALVFTFITLLLPPFNHSTIYIDGAMDHGFAIGTAAWTRA